MQYHELWATPYVLVFVVAWLLLKLVDCITGLSGGPGIVPVVRLIIVIVALIVIAV